MIGPTILARSMSIATRRGSDERAWQYHSRSDKHSKLACWTLLLDLLSECDVLRAAAAAGRIGFAINYLMVGPINKTLDLVVTLNPKHKLGTKRRTFVDLMMEYGVELSEDERVVLAALPELYEDVARNASEVAIALEAKACMTEHVKSLPRLHAEIVATGLLAKQAASHCILGAYALVNSSPTFISPGAKGVNQHRPEDFASKVVGMLQSAIPMIGPTANLGFGFDALGVTVIECRNDGSPVSVVENRAPAPPIDSHVHYEHMIRKLCSAFRSRFPA